MEEKVQTKELATPVLDELEVEHTDYIEIYGAREHNLKDIDVKFKRNQLVVITGISGKWQIFSSLRYNLCRRAKAVYGKFFSICKKLSWRYGATRR